MVHDATTGALRLLVADGGLLTELRTAAAGAVAADLLARPGARSAAVIGISRSTFREAARTLESEGLVRYQMNRGIVVSDITGPDVTDIYAGRAAVELAAVDALTSRRDPAVYVGAAELQRLLDLLAHRKQLAHRDESETPRG